MKAPNAGEVAENGRLLTLSIVNLLWLQGFHTEHPSACLPGCGTLREFVSDS